MSAAMEVLILGSGTSHGVPMIACDCPVCLSANPKNKRTRCSVLISFNDKNVVIDTSLDFRAQMLTHNIQHVDAVLFTHSHADHLHGFDDLRRFNAVQKGVIPLYASPSTAREIRRQYRYAFSDDETGSSRPYVDLHAVSEPFDLFGRTLVPLRVWHGPWEVTAWRADGFAYVCDTSRIEAPEMERLRGLDVLVIDGLRHRPHPTHFNIAQAIDIVRELRPRRAFLTHITHDIDHDPTNAELPPGIELAYDGLRIELA